MGDESFTNSKTDIISKDVLALEEATKEEESNGECIKNEEETKDSKRRSKWILWPNRAVIIEPAFALFFTFHIASFPLTSQYTYFAIGERYNLSAYKEAAESRNDSKGKACGEGPEGNENSTYYQLQQEVQAENAMFNMYMELLSEIPGLFALMFMGTFMDKLGRKPGLLISLVGTIFRNIVIIIQMTLGLPLAYISIGYFIGAITGGHSTFLTACISYYADTIPQKKLGFRMTIADVVFGLMLAVMSSGIGYMIAVWGFLWPYVFIEGGHLLNLIYIVFCVPESVRMQGRKKAVSITYILTSLKVLPKKRPNGGRVLLLLFASAWCVLHLALGSRDLQTLFQLNYPLCWSSIKRGNWNAIGAGVSNVSQIVMSLVLFRYSNVVSTMLLAMFSQFAYLVIFAFSTASEMMYFALIAGFAMGACQPLMRSILAGLVSLDERGAIFASVTAIDRLLSIGISPLLNLIYAETLDFFSGTVFLLLALFAAIAIVLVIIFLVKRKRLNAGLVEDTVNVVTTPELPVKEPQEDVVINTIRL